MSQKPIPTGAETSTVLELRERLAHRPEEHGVVDGQRQALGELDREGEVVGVEHPPRSARGSERHRSERAAAGDERRRQERGRGEPPVQLPMLLVERDLVERGVGPLGLEQRLPAGDDARNGMLRIAEDGPAGAKLVERPLALGIRVDVDDVVERPVLVHQVDEAVVGDRGHEQARDRQQRVFDVGGGRQRPPRVGEHAEPLVVPPAARQLVKDVDHEVAGTVIVDDGRRAHERPAALAGCGDPVADRPLDLATGLGCEAARQLAPWERRGSVAVEQLETLDDRRRRRVDEILGGVEAGQLRGDVIGEDDRALAILDGDPVGRALDDRLELVPRDAHRILGPSALDGGRDVAGDRNREPDVLAREGGRPVGVEDEAPEDRAGVDERHEQHRADALVAHRVVQLRDLGVEQDVVDDERLGVGDPALPRRAPLDVGAVGLGDAAPGAEVDRVARVEEDDGAAGDAECTFERVEGGTEDLVQRPGRGDGAGKGEHGSELVGVAHELAVDAAPVDGRGAEARNPAERLLRGLVEPAVEGVGELDPAEPASLPIEKRLLEPAAGVGAREHRVVPARVPLGDRGGDRRRLAALARQGHERGVGPGGRPGLFGEVDQDRVQVHRGACSCALAPPCVSYGAHPFFAYGHGVPPGSRSALMLQTRGYTAMPRGPLAQLVEQGTLNPKVEGSNPSRPMP